MFRILLFSSHHTHLSLRTSFFLFKPRTSHHVVSRVCVGLGLLSSVVDGMGQQLWRGQHELCTRRHRAAHLVDASQRPRHGRLRLHHRRWRDCVPYLPVFLSRNAFDATAVAKEAIDDVISEMAGSITRLRELVIYYPFSMVRLSVSLAKQSATL